MRDPQDGSAEKSIWHEIVRLPWPWVLTAASIFGGLALVFFISDRDYLAALGSLIGGVGSVVAFIWLIAAYMQQGKELALQRGELKLQREAIELQREEMSKLGKYAGMEQVARMFELFEARLIKDNGPAKSIRELSIIYVNMMLTWKQILDDRAAPGQVIDLYNKWTAIESPCRDFMGIYMAAVDLYCEAAGIELVRPDLTAIQRVWFFNEKFVTYPHIANYSSSATGVATQLFLGEPGLDKLRLKMLEASEATFPGVVKTEGLAALRAKVQAHNESVARGKAAAEQAGESAADKKV